MTIFQKRKTEKESILNQKDSSSSSSYGYDDGNCSDELIPQSSGKKQSRGGLFSSSRFKMKQQFKALEDGESDDFDPHPTYVPPPTELFAMEVKNAKAYVKSKSRSCEKKSNKSSSSRTGKSAEKLVKKRPSSPKIKASISTATTSSSSKQSKPKPKGMKKIVDNGFQKLESFETSSSFSTDNTNSGSSSNNNKHKKQVYYKAEKNKKKGTNKQAKGILGLGKINKMSNKKLYNHMGIEEESDESTKSGFDVTDMFEMRSTRIIDNSNKKDNIICYHVKKEGSSSNTFCKGDNFGTMKRESTKDHKNDNTKDCDSVNSEDSQGTYGDDTEFTEFSQFVFDKNFKTIKGVVSSSESGSSSKPDTEYSKLATMVVGSLHQSFNEDPNESNKGNSIESQKKKLSQNFKQKQQQQRVSKTSSDASESLSSSSSSSSSSKRSKNSPFSQKKKSRLANHQQPQSLSLVQSNSFSSSEKRKDRVEAKRIKSSAALLQQSNSMPRSRIHKKSQSHSLTNNHIPAIYSQKSHPPQTILFSSSEASVTSTLIGSIDENTPLPDGKPPSSFNRYPKPYEDDESSDSSDDDNGVDENNPVPNEDEKVVITTDNYGREKKMLVKKSSKLDEKLFSSTRALCPSPRGASSDNVLTCSNSSKPPFQSPCKKVPTGVPSNAVLGSMLFRQTHPSNEKPAAVIPKTHGAEKKMATVTNTSAPVITVMDRPQSPVSSVTEEASSFYQKNFQKWDKPALSVLENYRQNTSMNKMLRARDPNTYRADPQVTNNSNARLTRVEEEHRNMFIA